MTKKISQGFDYAETGPNAGQPVRDAPTTYKLPGSLRKFSGGDVDDLEGGDPMQMMPKLRQIHKLGASLRTKLLPHQERVVRKIGKKPGLVVAHGLGSGKTLSSIAAAVRLDPDRTQVLVPASLKSNYEKEMKKHVIGRLPKVEVGSLQRATVQGQVKDSDLLIVDEAHRARNPTSKTYEVLKGAKAGKRLLLTASPTYNRPADVATLVNLAAGNKILPMGSAFEKEYVDEPPKGLLGLLPFVRKHPVLQNKAPLKKTLDKWVDYHKSQGAGFPQVTSERVSVPMSRRQTFLHDVAWGKLPLTTKLRLNQSMPPSKQDLPKLNVFQSQTRQISGTEGPFTKGEPKITPKLQRALGDFESAEKANPNHRALVYANHLGTLKDYSAGLESKKIPHALYTGSRPMKERKGVINDYNRGKLKALLVSSAGGEGLDLKGTRQVQILEPHWNNEKLKQVEGRAVRQGSHSHLPPNERKVAIQRFETHPLGGIFRNRRGIEQVLNDVADNKEQLNNELLGLLEKKSSLDAFVNELERIKK